MQRLELLKALGDNTRYAIYLEIARSAAPKSTADIADTLGLHQNTIRPHLERMREVGLLEVEIDGRGSVGRPTNRYSLATDAPSLGLEPPAFPTLAAMLATVANQAGAAFDDIVEVGRRQGRSIAVHRAVAGTDGDLDKVTDARACGAALAAALADLGFDPAFETAGDSTAKHEAGHGRSSTIAFTHCPYRELAEAYPSLVCSLHRGIVEGFVAETGERAGIEWHVDEFHSLVDRSPCQVSTIAV